LWPGPDAIGIIFAVSHGSAGVVVLACGLMYLEPTKGCGGSERLIIMALGLPAHSNAAGCSLDRKNGEQLSIYF